MRILYLTPEFGGQTGGIGTSLATLATGLQRLGHEISVITRSPVAEECWRGELDVRALPCSAGHFARWVFRSRAAILGSLVNADVIHAPEWGAVGSLVPRRAGPLVTRLDTPSWMVRELSGRTDANARERLVEIAERVQARRSKLILAPSAAIAAAVTNKWRLDPQRVRYLPNPIDLSQFRALRLGDVVDRAGIVFLGRVEPRKGLHDVAHTLAKVSARQNTMVTAIGSGHDSLLAAEITRTFELHGGAIEFTGPLRHGDAMARLSTAKVLVIPSRWENAPVVALEGMALGIPIVANCVGGLVDIVSHGRTGFLLPVDDAAAWVHCLERLISDEALNQRLSDNARFAVQKYDVSTVARNVERLYLEAAG